MNLTTFYNTIDAILWPLVAPAPGEPPVRTPPTWSNVNTFKIGYLTELDTTQNTYDVLLVNPPKEVEQDRRSSKRTWEIRMFLVAKDDDGTGNKCTDAQRIAIWDGLITEMNKILNGLLVDITAFHLTSQITKDLNSGGGDGILRDLVIWVETTFTIELENCD